MKFDYYELLSIKASLEFVQKKSKQLDLSCLIKKENTMIEIINKKKKNSSNSSCMVHNYGKDKHNNED